MESSIPTTNLPAGSTPKPIHLPGLDGLRAIASLAVLFGHIYHVLPESILPTLGNTMVGQFAVTVFFVLSGFLITLLLLREKEQTGRISIYNFYVRRTLRIWPLYFLVILAGLGVTAIFAVPYDANLIWYYLFFIANIPVATVKFISYISHLWSLGVEEQFYLFWPWLIKWVRRPAWALLAFLILFTMLKWGFRFGLGGNSLPYLIMFMTRFDCMAIGGLAACIYYGGISPNLARLIHAWPLQVASWAILAITAPGWLHISTLLDHDIVALAAAHIILNLAHNPRPVIAFRASLWRYLADISFALYMWHPLVIASLIRLWPKLDIRPLPNALLIMAVSLLLSIGIAHLSTFYFERPILKLKARLQR